MRVQLWDWPREPRDCRFPRQKTHEKECNVEFASVYFDISKVPSFLGKVQGAELTNVRTPHLKKYPEAKLEGWNACYSANEPCSFR